MKNFLVLGSNKGSKFCHIYVAGSIKECLNAYRGNEYKVLFCKELKNLGGVVDNMPRNINMTYADYIKDIYEAYLDKDLKFLNTFVYHSDKITRL